jgi:curved DNA-binding protein CbpA
MRVRGLQRALAMAEDVPVDYYEILQISVNAEPETIHRVYRILAQRYHPDNAETGNGSRFRQIAEAYRVLSDPEERARFDAQHDQQRQERWNLVKAGAAADNDFDVEQRLRMTVLEVLFTKRRVEPAQPGVFHIDLEKLSGRPREHLEFTIWYLVQKKLVQRTDNSLLAITAEGIDYLEERTQSMPLSRRLAAVNQ